MRKVTCKDCKKQYDYDKDDFCPKCGSYNPPVDPGSTRIERELLSRFGDGREGQKRAAPARQPGPVQTGAPRPAPKAAANRRTPVKQYKPSGVGAAVEGRARHDKRIEGCGSCKKRPKEKDYNRGPVIMVVVIIAVALLANLLPVVVTYVVDMGTRASAAITSAEGAGGQMEIVTEVHGIGEEFSLNRVKVTVDDLWWVDLSSIPSYEQKGMRCLAVSVNITGGEVAENLAIAVPVIELEDGTQIPLNHDGSFAHAVRKLELYNITLSDYQWESNLWGQFMFFLPEDITGTVHLILNEFQEGNPDSPKTAAVHSVPLELPSL